MLGSKSSKVNINGLGNKLSPQYVGVGHKIFDAQPKLNYLHIGIPKVQNVKKSILER